jgi:hypothetical protein
MFDAPYLRRQADICLRLARRATDTNMAAELVRIAEDFVAMATEIETLGSGGACGSREPPG